MEMQWYLDRHYLRCLKHSHPDWSQRRLAEETGYSKTWVQKWCKRFEQADQNDEPILHSQSRARHHPPPSLDQTVVDEIIKIRDEPPEGLNRTPGPQAIRYYLGRSEVVTGQVPAGTTIWRILDRYQRIHRIPKPEHEPTTREAPLAVLQIDFKDVSGIEVNTDKKQHQVESLNMIDKGTSILIDNPARPDFNAETVIEALTETFGHWGLPQRIEFDRDARFVGSWTQGEFPSALMRFLGVLGVEYTIHPPHRPDKNGFVERYNRTYKSEAIQIYLPQTLSQVEEMNRDFRYHYNFVRPNQALTCGNQPPRQAFPDLPILPKLPDEVDPDRWLQAFNGRYFKRRLDGSGRFQLGRQRYYAASRLAKQVTLVQLDAVNKQLKVHVAEQVVRTLPIKGLIEGRLPFQKYLTLIKKDAFSERRHALRAKMRYSSIAA